MIKLNFERALYERNKKYAFGNCRNVLVIICHLFFTTPQLKTDFIAIIGIILVIKGYCTKDKDDSDDEKSKS